MRSYIWHWLLLSVGAVAVVVVLVGAGGVNSFTPPIQQPFPFNHKQHIEADWTCSGCHVYVDMETIASIPNAVACVECHESERVEEKKGVIPEFAELRRLVEQGEEIPWVRIHQVPSHVFFSHRRHVEVGEVDCIVCHGDMAQRTEPVGRQTIPIEMNRCIDCHIEEEVTIDCLSCHR